MESRLHLQSAPEGEVYCPDSAYGSSVLDTDTEEGHTPPSNNIIYYNEELMHKTILVGDSGVGKTSLLVQFDQGKFIPGSFSATVGIGFTNKVVVVDGVKVKLQIWDTAGQERFRSVTHAYYRDAQALLLLYDITSKSSFDNITADITSERAIKREEGEKLAREYGVPFIETSAKTGINVELAFLAVAKELKHRSVNQPNELKFQIHEYIESQREKSSCCGFE
ncbi:ras-related protein Rab-37-like isoform X3 [Scyliorhinus canicula]|uniref:ras-related protein Rab-37-like isoform X3 n=1 Tax=Scyliorhinus canicula TaxID=7830 RepID=UPI0018F40A4C|nr:ras-related protein Rab-37-like isoform X3 [Scyliorhinus canicula]